MSRRALVVERPGSIAVEERPSLLPGPGEVVVRPAHCGLCGTDLELLRGYVDPAFVRYPLTIGHEWSGVVSARGDGVANLGAGDRCVVECIVPCGRCPACRRGATNVCERYDELGFTREGGASDEALVPARLVHPLADAVDLVDAALVEPASVVMRGLEKVVCEPAARVLVIGDGTIALLAAHLVQLWSPAETLVLGRRADQRDLAGAVGATAFEIDDRAAGGGFDLVIEAAGTVDAVRTAVAACRRGGAVLQLGLPPAGSTLALPGDLLVNNDLALVASFGYTSAAFARVVALLGRGRITPGVIVTHRFPLERFADALAALEAGEGPRGKVLLDIAGDGARLPASDPAAE